MSSNDHMFIHTCMNAFIFIKKKYCMYLKAIKIKNDAIILLIY